MKVAVFLKNMDDEDELILLYFGVHYDPSLDKFMVGRKRPSVPYDNKIPNYLTRIINHFAYNQSSNMVYRMTRLYPVQNLSAGSIETILPNNSSRDFLFEDELE